MDIYSADEALSELARRRQSIEQLKAEIRMDIQVPEMRVELNGQLIFKGDQWLVEIVGPLGIKVAVIEAEGERFRLHLPQSARIYEGILTEGLMIPELELLIPGISSLDMLFLPVPNIQYAQEWRVMNAHFANGGTLNLYQDSNSGLDSLVLTLDYQPLRIIGETYYYSDTKRVSRQFWYSDSDDVLPDAITISLQDFVLNFFFNSMELKLSTFRSASGKEM